MDFVTILPGTNQLQHIVNGPNTQWEDTNNNSTTIIIDYVNNNVYTNNNGTLIKNK